jgi:hypothetical protein
MMRARNSFCSSKYTSFSLGAPWAALREPAWARLETLDFTSDFSRAMRLPGLTLASQHPKIEEARAPFCAAVCLPHTCQKLTSFI